MTTLVHRITTKAVICEPFMAGHLPYTQATAHAKVELKTGPTCREMTGVESVFADREQSFRLPDTLDPADLDGVRIAVADAIHADPSLDWDVAVDCEVTNL